jgi:hypothetical protein
MKNFINRLEVINKIKDKEYNNEELNIWLGWSISKYATEIIDLIINQPNFVIDENNLGSKHLNVFVEHDDIKRFKYFLNLISIKSYHSFGSDSSSTYKLMKDICWYNKLNFLKLIIDLPELDFSVNNNIIFHRTYKNEHYEILSMLLERDEIKSQVDMYKKFSFILRNHKLNQLKKRIYTHK